MTTYKIYVFESLEGIVEAASATQAEEKADDYMTRTCIDDIEARLLSFPKDVDHESYVDCLIARERIWFLPKDWTIEQKEIDRAAR
mgnify:CR=1 FL=1